MNWIKWMRYFWVLFIRLLFFLNCPLEANQPFDAQRNEKQNNRRTEDWMMSRFQTARQPKRQWCNRKKKIYIRIDKEGMREWVGMRWIGFVYTRSVLILHGFGLNAYQWLWKHFNSVKLKKETAEVMWREQIYTIRTPFDVNQHSYTITFHAHQTPYTVHRVT